LHSSQRSIRMKAEMLPDCMALLRQASFFLLNDRGEGGGTKRLGVIYGV
jgi:hypothetical protein